MRIYRSAKYKQREYTQKKMESEFSDLNIEELLEDPKKLLSMLKDKILRSGKNMKDIFKSFDTNNDGVMNLKEFKNAFIISEIEIPEQLLVACFRRMDVHGNNNVSYLDFLSIIYEQENQIGVFDRIAKIETALSDFRTLTNGKFKSKKIFLQESNSRFMDCSKITDREFRSFVHYVTRTLSVLQIRDVKFENNSSFSLFLTKAQKDI